MNRFRLALSALLLLAAACTDTVVEPPPPPVMQVALDLPSLALGDRVPLTVRFVVDDVQRVATPAEYTVTSSDPSVVEVAADGIVTAQAQGTAVVRVTWTAQALTVERTVQVAPPQFVGVRLSALAPMIPGDSASATFIGFTLGGASIAMPDGAQLTSRTSVVGVGGKALVIAREVGTTWLVVAMPNGVADSQRVSVALGAPVDLTITPNSATMNVGDTVRITSQVVDRRNNLISDTPPQFRTTNGAATVSASGMVIARSGGTVRVIASTSGLADTLVAIVNTLPAPPAPPPPPPGDPDPPPPPPPPPVVPPTTITPPNALVQVWLSGTPTVAVTTAFTNAAARVNGLLRSNSGAYPVTLFVPAGTCFQTQPEIDQLVPVLLITASVGAIDGPGSILGFAGPCLLRTGTSGIPVVGIMAFDQDDMQQMATLGILEGVVLHEMLHILGIGTLWGPNYYGLVFDPFAPDPRFIGPGARAEFSLLDAIGGATGVPVENTGGSGTRGSHWRESIFRTELMTGWAGGAMQMSRVTVAALADMGYDVDMSRADPFVLSVGGVSGLVDRGVEIIDQLIAPIGTVDRTGRWRP